VPTETVSILNTLLELGGPGVVIVVVFLLWREFKGWIETQQLRESERSLQFQNQYQTLVERVLNGLELQSTMNNETATMLRETALELRVTTERIERIAQRMEGGGS